jgi:hypothetical protein
MSLPDLGNFEHYSEQFPATTYKMFTMLGGVPVPTAWRVLGLRMEEWPPAMEVSCEYTE